MCMHSGVKMLKTFEQRPSVEKRKKTFSTEGDAAESTEIGQDKTCGKLFSHKENKSGNSIDCRREGKCYHEPCIMSTVKHCETICVFDFVSHLSKLIHLKFHPKTHL